MKSIEIQLVNAFENLDLKVMELAINAGANGNCTHPDGGTILRVAVDHTIDNNIQAGG